MTHAVALTGQWEGLRAFPRASRPPSTEFTRKRLQLGLERLEGVYERMAARAALLQQGMERLNGLRSGMIDQLDAIEGDPDFEPSLGGQELRHNESQVASARLAPLDGGAWGDLEEDSDFEPSLCGVSANWNPHSESSDRESDLSWGAEYAMSDQTRLTVSVEGDDHEDKEPSLSAVIMLHAGDQSGARWIGGGDERDLEFQCEDEGAPSGDDEASLCGVGFGAEHQSGPRVRDAYDREIEYGAS